MCLKSVPLSALDHFVLHECQEQTSPPVLSFH